MSSFSNRLLIGCCFTSAPYRSACRWRHCSPFYLSCNVHWVMCVRTFKVALFCLMLHTFPVFICCNWKKYFIMSHCRTLCCLGDIIQDASHWLFIFTGVVPETFSRQLRSVHPAAGYLSRLSKFNQSLCYLKCVHDTPGLSQPQSAVCSLQTYHLSLRVFPLPTTHTHTPQKHHVAAACLSVLFRISWESVRNVQACTGMSKRPLPFCSLSPSCYRNQAY